MTQIKSLEELHALFPDDDHAWVDRSLAQLLRSGVSRPYADAALTEAAIARDGEGRRTEDVHGTPDTWVAARVAIWREEGEPAWDIEHTTSTRSGLITAFWLAAGLSLLFGLSDLMYDRPVQNTLGYLLLPTLVGLVCIAFYLSYEHTLRRGSRLLSLAVGAVVAAIGIAVIVASIFATQGRPLLETGRSVCLFQALGNALIAVILGKVLPRKAADRTMPPDPSGTPDMTDEEWLAACGQALRGTSMDSENRIQAHLDEARAHAALSGNRLAEEFGNPVTYALGLPRDRKEELRRRLLARATFLLLFLLMGFNALLRDGDMGLIAVGLIATCLLLMGDTAREYRKTRKGQ